ncbi:MAG: hypothetical protein IKZ61_07085 [Prevotella sp.]|nr:hypothetical protein [Prevotella sp.]
MKKAYILIFLAMLTVGTVNAQRHVDNLGRGLVAIPENNFNYITWRRLGTEYYDVTYNLYKNGSLLASGLTTTNYSDNQSATSDTQYQVAAVVGGVEQEKCKAIKTWEQYDYNSCTAGFIDIPLAAVYDREGNDVTSHYEPNDAEFADLDGDGELEMIIKRLNTVDATGVFTNTYADVNDKNGNPIPIYRIYPYESKEFVVLDAYDINWHPTDENAVTATLMWRIDCGPNMVSSNSTEINIIAFDWWQKDGKAEVVLRGADNMIVYGNDGRTRLYTIGDMNANTRQNWMSHRQSDGTNIASMAYTNSGAEYLLYLNGETGELYQQMEYPLKRLEAGETDLSAAWGDGYGHRSSKYFFGVPYLNGQEPTLFMARGIYTRHKMMVMYLDYQNRWVQLWTWNNNISGSPWYGQGYHNFVIADVDEDGRDEIVYGSMVIDDNFQGLSTTGLGHGDAQHVGDFDPYRPGLEFFGCNEDNPGMNYRNATTSEIYIRKTADKDDGRALIGNFSSTIPGCIATSASTDLYSSVKDIVVATAPTDTRAALYWSQLNFRIFWDGDLGDEVLNSPGTARDAAIIDHENGRIFQSDGCNMNNDSKNNPCFQGDLIGDWREEIVVRCGQNVRIYTSGMSTNYSLPTLWHDHQYRQAMVWQMMAYNQPPHLSYFLGEMEGYTVAPPPLITNGREVVGNNTNIDGSYNGKHVLHNEYDNTSISISGGSPAVLTINVPTWVQGHDNNNNITTTTYSCNLTGGAMSGETRLVKQGNGILNMSNAVHTNSGATDIWGGTVNFDGTIQNSAVWMNRHTTLNTTGGTFNNGLTMEYGATLNVGGGDCSRVNISELTLNYGARVVLDVNGMDDAEHDWLNATILNIDDSKAGIDAWENYGPEYIEPVFKLNMSSTLGNGRYPIGNVTTVNGDLSRVKIECAAINASNLRLIHEDGILYLQVSDVATANEATIALTGMAPYGNVKTAYPSTSPEKYYLPIVSIVANNTNGQAPTLSGTFTSLDGTETSIGSTNETVLYNENYENASNASDWTTQYASVNFMTGHDTYGNYIEFTHGNGSGPRNAYKKLETAITAEKYTIEFDAAMHYTVGNYTPNKIILYGVGAQMPYSNTEISTTNYLFKISGGVNYSTNYTVEEASSTYTLSDAAWYHYIVNVDQNNRTITYTIKSGSSEIGTGSYTISDTNINLNLQGFYVETGRAWSYIQIDNIKVAEPPTNINSFTFTEPGTLRVYSSVDGYASGIKTFEAKYPFIKTGNSGSISNDYLPVAIHDELATTLPQAVSTTGNAHLWRNGLTSTSTWATMVVPFDMTVAQVREVFGNEVTVANLETGKGNGGQIYFETIEVETANDNITAITANEPCLIKGVTKSAPYLIMGITSAPTLEPFISNGYFSFVGTYTDLGQKAFTTDDYFFTTSGLSRVETDGIKMRLKGYRGYFQGLTSNGAKNVQTVFEDSGVSTEILDIPTSTRNEVYDLQGRKIPENWRLKKGVYIVNGRKVIVK